MEHHITLYVWYKASLVALGGKMMFSTFGCVININQNSRIFLRTSNVQYFRP